jgi:hypothetical protein
MPDDVVAFLETQRWGEAHFEFHSTRRWDGFNAQQRQDLEALGMERNPLQEGAKTTGLEFLAMHRHLLGHMRGAFPAHAALLTGWTTVPTDPDDAATPMETASPEEDPAFDPEMQQALDRIADPVRLAAFPDDDAFGLWIQTALVPRAGGGFSANPDETSGLHNYLHRRWADLESEVNLQFTLVNMQHEYFWRLHGWLDAQWTRYRAAKGKVDVSDATYQAAMEAARTWMHAHSGPLPDDDDDGDGRNDDLGRPRCPAALSDGLVEAGQI